MSESIEALRGERDRMAALLLQLPALMAELDPLRLTAGMLDAACAVTGAVAGAYVSADPADGGPLVTDGYSVRPQLAQASLLAAVLGEGHVARVDDVTSWAASETAARGYGVLAGGRLVRSLLAMPVRERGHRGIVGALVLAHHRTHAFGGAEERLLGGLSDQLGVGLWQAELFAERSRVTQALQQTLLPPLLPGIDGVDLAARYRPAGPGNLVGGDFYDVFEVGAGRWGILLGDVSGTGPEAAALTGLARYTVRALADGELPPGRVLGRLNETLLRQHLEDRFCTAIYLTFAVGPDGLRVTLANGGHPPPLILRDDERLEVAQTEGLLLGILPDVVPADDELTLRRGDVLVLYTDGVIEARNDKGEQFGNERLEALVATCAGRSAAGIARRIELSVLDHQAAETPDDVAVLALRATARQGSAARG